MLRIGDHNKFLKALLVLAGCYGVFLLTQSSLRSDVPQDHRSEPINVVIICGKYYQNDTLQDATLTENLFLLLHSIFGTSSGSEIHFEILVYDRDISVVQDSLDGMMKKARELKKKVSHNIVSLDFISKVYSEDLRIFRQYYGKGGSKESLPIHRIITPLFQKIFDYSKIIYLDASSEFRVDIQELWSKFYMMKKSEMIAAAYEQSPHYKIALKEYRRGNPSTKIGSPPPRGFPGYSTSVMLFDLAKLRASKEYSKSLLQSTSERWQNRYHLNDFLGDHDFFTLLGAEFPYLFHVLGCEWNKQTDPRLFSDSEFYVYHMCWKTPKVYSGPKIPVE